MNLNIQKINYEKSLKPLWQYLYCYRFNFLDYKHYRIYTDLNKSYIQNRIRPTSHASVDPSYSCRFNEFVAIVDLHTVHAD
ncbi:hypothetical protein DHD05_22175 [Arenibacter sp. N53]|nr:hypothetical protein [Arenibacter sp. N53]